MEAYVLSHLSSDPFIIVLESSSGLVGDQMFCLLTNGANPLLKANLSLQALLGIEEVNECSHEELDPAKFAERVPASLTSMSPRKLRTGWEVIRHVLRHSQAEWKVKPSRRRSTSRRMEHDDEFKTFIEYSEDEMSIDDEASHDSHLPIKCPDEEYHQNFFGESKVLASLWAAVRTELLTYRRLEVGDEWISQNFNMDALYKSLSSKGDVATALVQKEMMKPSCGCGEFPDQHAQLSTIRSLLMSRIWRIGIELLLFRVQIVGRRGAMNRRLLGLPPMHFSFYLRFCLMKYQSVKPLRQVSEV